MKNFNPDLEEIKQQLSLLTACNPNHVVFDNAQLAEFLNVTTRTLQNWRNDGLIAYRKVGACIFYTLADVSEFLDMHKHPSIKESRNSNFLKRA